MRKQGKTYRQISSILNCSGGLVAYYLLPHTKEKIVKQTLVSRYRKRLKYKLLAGGKCNKCGYNRCLDALCFHHLDASKKSFQVSTAIASGNKSHRQIMSEIKKCILICSNCHFESHSKEMEYQNFE